MRRPFKIYSRTPRCFLLSRHGAPLSIAVAPRRAAPMKTNKEGRQCAAECKSLIRSFVFCLLASGVRPMPQAGLASIAQTLLLPHGAAPVGISLDLRLFGFLHPLLIYLNTAVYRRRQWKRDFSSGSGLLTIYSCITRCCLARAKRQAGPALEEYKALAFVGVTPDGQMQAAGFYCSDGTPRGRSKG